MTTLRNAAMLMAACLALSACASDETTTSEAPETPLDIAKADYERITAASDFQRMSDILVYPAGEAAPVRTRMTCQADECVTDAAALFLTSDLSLEGVEVTILSDAGGVRKVQELISDEIGDTHVLGGWMSHSLFASQADLYAAEGSVRQGMVRVLNYSQGDTAAGTPTVPMSGARWSGFVVGRDIAAWGAPAQRADLSAVVEGAADISVHVVEGELLADVSFTGLASTYGEYDDMAWSGLMVTADGFSQGADDDRISGQFYGPEHQEVAGIFERSHIAGAFGGLRR